MQRSTERILTTHAGRLPNPDNIAAPIGRINAFCIAGPVGQKLIPVVRPTRTQLLNHSERRERIGQLPTRTWLRIRHGNMNFIGNRETLIIGIRPEGGTNIIEQGAPGVGIELGHSRSYGGRGQLPCNERS